MSTLLTIGMPLYNEARHLKMTLASLLSQSFTDFQIIASNNNSSDETANILAEFSASDMRIKVYHQEQTLPAVENGRFVINACDTQLFMLAAGHDIYDPDFIDKTIQPLLQDPNVVLSYPVSAWFSNSNAQSLIPGRFETRGMSPMQRMHTVAWGLVYAFQFYGIFRYDPLRTTLDAADLTGVIGPDHILLTRLAAMGDFALVQELLFYMRQNDDFGDNSSYLKKLTGNESSESAFGPYIEQIGHYLDIADNLAMSETDRHLLRVSLLQCTLLRYRNTLDITGGSFDEFIRSGLFREFITQRNLVSVLPF